MNNSRPILGISMGDPAGCGPELTLKALINHKKLYGECRPVVVGDAKVFEKAIKTLKWEEKVKVNKINDVEEAKYEYGTVDILHLDLVDMEKFEPCKVSKMCGEAAFRSVEKVISLALDKKVDATITNAFNKEAVNLAGHHYSGHTEIYASLTGTNKYTMMLTHEDLRVVHVSTHVSLREACDRVKRKRVYEVIKIAHEACKNLGIGEPKIGVAGLNPHSGENGLFGREEIEEIIPAIEMANKEGMKAEGPVPPDTVFSKAIGGWYDIIVAMYHDQGHIPLKVEGFVYNKAEKKWGAISGVNITLGLPIIRASVDHGTAFDSAWQGVQSEASLVNAIEYGILFANNTKI